jgi:hypothetical protein
LVSPKKKLITCRAMAHLLEPMLDDRVERVVLDIALHLSPDRLRQRLMDEVAALEEPGVDIILGYGLCGRALEGVASQKSRLILPRVDDCVGALLGSRKRHQSVLINQPGCYFVEPAWLGTEFDVLAQSTKGLEKIPEERRPQIVKMILKNYTKLALLMHEGIGPEEVEHCQGLAAAHGFKFVQLHTDLGLLRRLAGGDWSNDDFIMTEPGCKIPFFMD